MFWPMVDSSIIHDNISSLIHKKCHPKSYQSDIKYHVTLNIIFSVLCVCEGGGEGGTFTNCEFQKIEMYGR